jgi:hypothetical protein
MTHVGYLVVGWGGSLAVLAAYASFLVMRGRAVAAGVPIERQRWMTSEDDA